MGLYGVMPPLMPRGKYKGEPIEDVPCEYLEWALEEWTGLSREITAEMEAQVKLKRGEGVSRGTVDGDDE